MFFIARLRPLPQHQETCTDSFLGEAFLIAKQTHAAPQPAQAGAADRLSANACRESMRA